MKTAGDTMCLHPFTGLTYRIGGRVHCCYKGEVPDAQPWNNGQEFWNSDFLRQLRRNAMTGVKSPECSNCWIM